VERGWGKGRPQKAEKGGNERGKKIREGKTKKSGLEFGGVTRGILVLLVISFKLGRPVKSPSLTEKKGV